MFAGILLVVLPSVIIHYKLRSSSQAVGRTWARDCKLVVRTVTLHQNGIRWIPIR